MFRSSVHLNQKGIMEEAGDEVRGRRSRPLLVTWCDKLRDLLFLLKICKVDAGFKQRRPNR